MYLIDVLSFERGFKEIRREDVSYMMTFGFCDLKFKIISDGNDESLQVLYYDSCSQLYDSRCIILNQWNTIPGLCNHIEIQSMNMKLKNPNIRRDFVVSSHS